MHEFLIGGNNLSETLPSITYWAPLMLCLCFRYQYGTKGTFISDGCWILNRLFSSHIPQSVADVFRNLHLLNVPSDVKTKTLIAVFFLPLDPEEEREPSCQFQFSGPDSEGQTDFQRKEFPSGRFRHYMISSVGKKCHRLTQSPGEMSQHSQRSRIQFMSGSVRFSAFLKSFQMKSGPRAKVQQPGTLDQSVVRKLH